MRGRQSRQEALSMYRSNYYSCGRSAEFFFSVATGPLIDSESGPFSFPTQEGTFDQIQKGSVMELTLHNGGLGYPWVDISKIKQGN